MLFCFTLFVFVFVFSVFVFSFFLTSFFFLMCSQIAYADMTERFQLGLFLLLIIAQQLAGALPSGSFDLEDVGTFAMSFWCEKRCLLLYSHCLRG